MCKDNWISLSYRYVELRLTENKHHFVLLRDLVPWLLRIATCHKTSKTESPTKLPKNQFLQLMEFAIFVGIKYLLKPWWVFVYY